MSNDSWYNVTVPVTLSEGEYILIGLYLLILGRYEWSYLIIRSFFWREFGYIVLLHCILFYICEGRNFTHMKKTVAWPHHFTKWVWARKTTLIPPLFIEVPVPIQEGELSCICVSGISILPLSKILIFDPWIVPTVCYFFVFIWLAKESKWDNAYLPSSPMGHKASTICCHLPLSFAMYWAWPIENPTSSSADVIVLLHYVLGVHCRATLRRLLGAIFKTYPEPSHLSLLYLLNNVFALTFSK